MKVVKHVVSCAIFLSLLPFPAKGSVQDLEAAVAGLSLTQQEPEGKTRKKCPQLTPASFSQACALGILSSRQKENGIRSLRAKYPSSKQSLTIRATSGIHIITDKTLEAYPALEELTLETISPEAAIMYQATTPIKKLRCISSAYKNIRILNPLPDTLEKLVLDMTTDSQHKKESICIDLAPQPLPCRSVSGGIPIELPYFFDVPQNVMSVEIIRHLKDPLDGEIRQWKTSSILGPFPPSRLYGGGYDNFY